MLNCQNLDTQTQQKYKNLIESNTFSRGWQSNKFFGLSLENQSQNWQGVLRVLDHSHCKELYLARCGINCQNIKVLTEESWPCLESLNLSSNEITSQTIKAFFKREWPNLKNFHLNSNKIENRGLLQILNSNQVKKMRILNISDNKISSFGLTLFPNINFKHLIRLVLNKNNIGSVGAKILSKSKFPILQELMISECNLNNQGVRHLSKAQFPKLTDLLIKDNYFSLDGIIHSSFNNWIHYETNQQMNIQNCWIGYMHFVVADWKKFRFNSQLLELYGSQQDYILNNTIVKCFLSKEDN